MHTYTLHSYFQNMKYPGAHPKGGCQANPPPQTNRILKNKVYVDTMILKVLYYLPVSPNQP